MINRKAFFLQIRIALFDGKISQSQVDGLTAILDEWDARGFTDTRWLAYIFATVHHETGRTFQPVTERGGQKYLKTKEYYPYYGRDLVQTTWKVNYEKVKKFTGVDVVSDPELIKDLKVSAKTAIEFMNKGWYTGKKLTHFFNDKVDDPKNARRIINGLDKAELIQSYYNEYNKALNY
jgi:putative chitinase